MTDDWERHARDDLEPKVRRSTAVLTIDPGADRIDPKIALETGYAVLLGKPIIVLVPEGVEPNPALLRAASEVIRLDGPLDSMAIQAKIQAALQKIR